MKLYATASSLSTCHDYSMVMLIILQFEDSYIILFISPVYACPESLVFISLHGNICLLYYNGVVSTLLSLYRFDCFYVYMPRFMYFCT